MSYLELVLNLSLLVSLSLVSGFIEKRWPQRTQAGVWLQGVLFGTVSVIGMLKPFVLGPGLIFDGRTVMVSLGALFFGAQAALIAAIPPVLCRIAIGGPGVYMGVATVVSAAVIGWLAREFIHIENNPPSATQLYLFGIAVHLVMLCCMLLLPAGLRLLSLERIGPPVVLAYPIATVLAGKVLSDQLRSIQRERRLQQTNQQLDITLNAIADGIIVVDTESRVEMMNPAAEALTGWGRNEAVGKPMADVFRIIHTETRQPVENPVQKVLEKGVIVGLGNHTTLIARDGTERNIADSAAPIRNEDGKVEGVVLVFRDVTEEYRLQQELVRSEDNFRRIFEEHAAVKLIIDPKDGRIVNANHAAAEFYGWSIDELKRMYIQDINTLSPDEVQAEMQNAARNHRIYFQFRHRLADGSIRDVAVYSSSIPMREGEMLHSIVHDITDRKRLEKQQRADQERIRAILDAAADPIVVYDTEGCPIFINPAFTRVFGWSLEELAGRQIPYVPEDQKEATRQKIETMIQTGEPVRLETRRFTKDGNELDVLVSASPMVDENGNPAGFVASLTDITRMKAMEQKLRQAQKMEAIGSLAGGIAHDFNNILFPISGLTQMCLWDAPQGSVLEQNLKKIYESTQRATDLVQQILSFSRHSEIQKTPVILQPIVKEVFKLTRSTIPANIEMQLDVQPELIRVMADPTQMHQVLMNLITNAFHAVETTGGGIRVELLKTDLEQDEAAGDKRLGKGSHALIRVSDTGCGIDPANMDKIFEPYFTTKPQGKGTGLGLAVVHGIVRDAGGDIRVESVPGKGTTFSIYLPLLEKMAAAEPAATAVTEIPLGNERILLVDDERPIIDMERRMLERLGYKVETFLDSESALTCFEADPLRFDIVLTDMSMPKMTGVQLSKRILAIRPGMPIILCTGHTEMIDEQAAKAIGIRALCPKPMAVEVMAALIRQVIDQGG